MVKYGLRPDTLKGELFRLLSEQGNKGMKVSDLAKSSPVRLGVEGMFNKSASLLLLLCWICLVDIFFLFPFGRSLN